MTYPGDSSLSPEVRQRILTTYRQTLQLASQGKSAEALLGCDFLLRLDAQFAPARSLQQMLQSGSPAAVFAELLEETPSEPAAARSGGAELGEQLSALLAERRFAELIALAERERAAVAAAPALRKLVEQARARQEAEPYVQAFLDPARQALQAGELEEFERLIKKARALDDSHPGLAELEEARGFYTDPTRSLGGRRRGIQMEEEAAAAPGETESFGADLRLPEVDFTEPPPAPASDGFELGAPAGGAGESAGRIAELLREGQAAFERREFQNAIDSWSRIFLIDIDHQEAARRIEQARQLKAEREREIEEIFHDAVERFDGGELDAAEQAFRRVLELQPSYVLAQEYLEKIEERRTPGAERPPAAELPAAPAAVAAAAAPRPKAREELSEEILVPPEPGVQRPARRPAASGIGVSAKRRGGPSGRFLAIGGAVLVLLVAAGWFVSSRWERLFPNAKPAATPAPALADPIAKARELHEQGRTAAAIAQLRRIAPDDPRAAEAQSLVSQWEAISEEAERPSLSLAASLRRRAAIERAQASADAGRNVEARSLLGRAAEIAPLAGAEAELLESVRGSLRPFDDQIALFEDGEYELALNQLWRRREAEKGNPDLDRLIVDAYHNLGVLDLQRGDPGAALEKFREARKLDDQDPALVRLERFASVYAQRGEDLLYRIYVKYLQPR